MNSQKNYLFPDNQKLLYIRSFRTHPDPSAMPLRADRLLALLLLEWAIMGVVDPIAEASRHGFIAWTIISGAAAWVTVICWYHFDSTARNFHRSKWMTTFVVFAAGLAMPVYLYRSRPAGTRIRALLKMLGFVLLLWIAAIVGALLGEMLMPG